MIDLHSHILPRIDDGAASMEVSLEMARLAVADGITHMACTPHIVPGVYENDTASIAEAVGQLNAAVRKAGIPLVLAAGADVHLAPDLPQKLKSGDIPTLNKSRYFLLEPPHHVVPPRIEDLALRVLSDGFVPIITHPERLNWIRSHYDIILRLNDLGCRIQLTADSLTGEFGTVAQSFAIKLIDEGRVDIIASDCHGAGSRPPRLARAREMVTQRVGKASADAMVVHRPAAILNDQPLPRVPALRRKHEEQRMSWIGALRRLAKIEGE